MIPPRPISRLEFDEAYTDCIKNNKPLTFENLWPRGAEHYRKAFFWLKIKFCVVSGSVALFFICLGIMSLLGK